MHAKIEINIYKSPRHADANPERPAVACAGGARSSVMHRPTRGRAFRDVGKWADPVGPAVFGNFSPEYEIFPKPRHSMVRRR